MTVSGSGSATLTLSGSASNINTYLDTASNIQYTSAADVNGNAAATVTVSATDGTVTTSSSSVDVNITAAADAPTLTSFSGVVASTSLGNGATITLSDLLSYGNEADVDGDSITAFEVQALSSGTLTIGGNAYDSSTNKTITSSDAAIWTPASGASTGSVNAFTVKAKDSTGSLSSSAVQVQVHRIDQIDSVSATDSSYSVGETVAITVSYGSTVTVNTSGGTPTLTLRAPRKTSQSSLT